MSLARSRRSVRKYSAAPVEKEKIRQCLEAARLSPSACNAQPYKFIIVDDGEKKKEFSAVFSGIYSPCAFALEAPVIAAIATQKQNLTARMGNILQNTDFKHVDIGIAGEHFVLQARELGLGTCWIGWFNKKIANRILNVPAKFSVEILISVGYPAGVPPERKKKNLEDLASYNKYE